MCGEPKTAQALHSPPTRTALIHWVLALTIAFGSYVAMLLGSSGRAFAELQRPDTGLAKGQTAATPWATGPALAQRLTTLVGVTLAGSPLRDGLYRFGRSQGVAVLLDRRIDPGQELGVTLSQVPLEQALRTIAEAGNMGVTQLGPVFYFGPVSATIRLRTLAAMKREELQELPRAVAMRLVQSRGWRWDDLATPRDLLIALAQEGQFELEGLEGVPHDLWAGADLPPLALLDRLTMVAIQFDLTFSVSPDGATVRLVPTPSEVSVVRRYPAGGQPAATAAKLAELAPDAHIRISGGGIFVKGTVEVHERILAARTSVRADRKPAPGAGPTRIERIAVQHIPVGAVLERIASQLDLELKIDGAALQRAGLSLNQPISVQVEDVSLDELLAEVAGAAGLAFRREGRVVEIRPAD